MGGICQVSSHSFSLPLVDWCAEDRGFPVLALPSLWEQPWGSGPWRCSALTVLSVSPQKCLRLNPDVPVWVSKQRILCTLNHSLKDVLNYGLFQPAFNGRAGKFLDEERLLREYPLNPDTPVPYLEVAVLLFLSVCMSVSTYGCTWRPPRVAAERAGPSRCRLRRHRRH